MWQWVGLLPLLLALPMLSFSQGVANNNNNNNKKNNNNDGLLLTNMRVSQATNPRPIRANNCLNSLGLKDPCVLVSQCPAYLPLLADLGGNINFFKGHICSLTQTQVKICCPNEQVGGGRVDNTTTGPQTDPNRPLIQFGPSQTGSNTSPQRPNTRQPGFLDPSSRRGQIIPPSNTNNGRPPQLQPEGSSPSQERPPQPQSPPPPQIQPSQSQRPSLIQQPQLQPSQNQPSSSQSQPSAQRPQLPQPSQNRPLFPSSQPVIPPSQQQPGSQFPPLLLQPQPQQPPSLQPQPSQQQPSLQPRPQQPGSQQPPSLQPQLPSSLQPQPSLQPQLPPSLQPQQTPRPGLQQPPSLQPQPQPSQQQPVPKITLPNEKECGQLPTSFNTGDVWPWVVEMEMEGGGGGGGGGRLVLEEGGGGRGGRCMGTLISPAHVLIPAHCITPRPPSRVRVAGQVATVMTQVDPGFDPQTWTHDIALLTVQPPLVFTDKVQPACLPFRFEFDGFRYQNLNQVALAPLDGGNGLVSEGVVDVVGLGICTDTYPSPTKVTRQHLCGTPTATTPNSRTSPCMSTAEASLMYLDEETTQRYYVVGLGAQSTPCDTSPSSPFLQSSPQSSINSPSQLPQQSITIGIQSRPDQQPPSSHPALYTRVGAYLEWIVENI